VIDRFTQVAIWLNDIANVAGWLLLSPIGWLPGFLSVTLAAVISGVLMLVMFKYTSNQCALQSVRNDIQSQFLALSLFRDSITVCLRAQGRILVGAARLLLLSLIPMTIMLVPMGLLISQLGLWFQSRPLQVGEEAVVALNLRDGSESLWPEVSLQPSDSFAATLGPVRVLSQRSVCWSIQAQAAGYHRIVFDVDGQLFEKQFAVGGGVMRVSMQRPDRKWPEVLLHPAESPFPPASPVKSIEIEYPARSTWTTGRDSWLIYWFIASLVSSVCFRRVLKVQL
jgi:hypothetical protein